MSTHAVDHIRRQTPKVVHPYRISVIHPYLLTLFKGGKAVLSQSSAWRNPNNSRRKPRPDANIKLLLDPPTAADARDDFPGPHDFDYALVDVQAYLEPGSLSW